MTSQVAYAQLTCIEISACGICSACAQSIRHVPCKSKAPGAVVGRGIGRLRSTIFCRASQSWPVLQSGTFLLFTFTLPTSRFHHTLTATLINSYFSPHSNSTSPTLSMTTNTLKLTSSCTCVLPTSNPMKLTELLRHAFFAEFFETSNRSIDIHMV